MALNKQIINYPLGVGLNTKADERAMEAPELAVCQNGEFEEVGGIQTRKPFVPLDSHASNTITNIRRLAVYDGELVAFTDVAVWSYSESDGRWTQRASYLAPKIEEQSRFVTTGEQFDCDQAQLKGITMFVWVETTPSASDEAYVAAIDTATGAVKLSPTALLTGNATRPKIVATDKKFVVVYHKASPERLVSQIYDPEDLSAATTGGGYVISGLVGMDLIQHPNSLSDCLAMATFSTTWEVVDILADAAPTLLRTKTATADGPCAIAWDSRDNDRICVVYTSGTAIISDILLANGTGSSPNVSVGTAENADVHQVACAFNGVDTFGVFWSALESNTVTASNGVEYNTIDTGGNTGTEAWVVRVCGMASRAFLHDGSIYIWIVFSGESTGGASPLVAQLQNSYFLYRSDGLLVAKATAATAGGIIPTLGNLPNVQDLGNNKWSWCGGNRGIITLGRSQKGYSAKSPRSITLEFDSDEARRSTSLGSTLYITGGQVAQYDGTNLVELGFHIFPWFIGVSTGAAGNLTGIYNYQSSYRWDNAKNEVERSTTASIEDTANVTSKKIDTAAVVLNITSKTGAAGEVALEYWRQVANANVGQPFYLATSKDPASTGDNGYQENDPTTFAVTGFTDNYTDANLISLEIWPENGGFTLESLNPPAATIIHATQDRIILAGIAGNPYQVLYSKERSPGEIASFHEALSVELPPEGGPITAIEFLNETLIVFKERAIYALPGDGFDNAGGGANYGPARIIANDVGATSAETVVLTPRGLVFHSQKGWYLLNRGWSAGYIGGPVSDFDDDNFVATHTLEDQHQVRCCSTDRILVWDYLVDQWSEWTVDDLTHSVIYNGKQHYASSSGQMNTVLAQEDNWTNNTTEYGLDVETAWIKTAGLQGFQRIWELMILGELVTACAVRIQVSYDYVNTVVDDKTWAPTGTSGPLQVMHSPTRQKCQAFKVRITARNLTQDAAPTTEAFKLTGIQLTYGQKRGRFKNLPAAQKQ